MRLTSSWELQASVDPCAAVVAAAVSGCGRAARRGAVVGDAAAVWQSGRIYGAGALLFFAGGAAGFGESPNAEILTALGIFRRPLYVDWRGACDAGAATQVAASDCAAGGVLCGGGCLAYCGAAGAAGDGVSVHAVGRRRAGAARCCRCCWRLSVGAFMCCCLPAMDFRRMRSATCFARMRRGWGCRSSRCIASSGR